MYSLKNSSGYDASLQLEGCSSKEAIEMRKGILETPNTEDIYEITGKKYYIPKGTPANQIPKDLEFGDALLFERGGLWRVTVDDHYRIPEGVIVGAYGEGEKPRFYGSAYNYADRSLWEKHDEHIWKRVMRGGNPGIITFDEKYALGVKKWTLEEVKEDYDYYYEDDTEIIYLYYDGDLEEFESIEIGQRGDAIILECNTVLDNVCVRHVGSHGVSGVHNAHNVKITNCEIGFIGGSRQFKQVRFGNGIEFGLGAQDIVVRNNWVYQCYDAGITFQSWTSGTIESYYHNIDFSANLIEYCYYGIEYFTTCKEDGGNYSEYKNITLNDNIIRFSAYTWSHEQRPDKWMASHIRGGQWAYVKNCEGFEIQRNIFDCCRGCIIFWWWYDETKNFLFAEPHNGLTVCDNTYYQGPTFDGRVMTYHQNVPTMAKDEAGLREGIARFDPKPKKIVWLEENK